jgi:hypothetical protein
MRQKFMSTPRRIWAAMVVGLAPIAGCELMEEEQEIEFRAAGLPRPATQEGPLLDEGESSGDTGAIGETEGWPLEWKGFRAGRSLPLTGLQRGDSLKAGTWSGGRRWGRGTGGDRERGLAADDGG